MCSNVLVESANANIQRTGKRSLLQLNKKANSTKCTLKKMFRKFHDLVSTYSLANLQYSHRKVLSLKVSLQKNSSALHFQVIKSTNEMFLKINFLKKRANPLKIPEEVLLSKTHLKHRKRVATIIPDAFCTKYLIRRIKINLTYLEPLLH